MAIRAFAKLASPIVLLGAAFPSWASPPVRQPQACTHSFCVQIIATTPDLSNKFRFVSFTYKGRDAMTVVLRPNGFKVTFVVKQINGHVRRGSNNEGYWVRSGDAATAWVCLRCGEDGEPDVVLGVSMVNIPKYYTNLPNYYIDGIFGLTVTVWPVNLINVGFNRPIAIGDPITIDSRKSINKPKGW